MPSTKDLKDPAMYQKIFHWAETQKEGTIPSFGTRQNDPYQYASILSKGAAVSLTHTSPDTSQASTMNFPPRPSQEPFLKAKTAPAAYASDSTPSR